MKDFFEAIEEHPETAKQIGLFIWSVCFLILLMIEAKNRDWDD